MSSSAGIYGSEKQFIVLSDYLKSQVSPKPIAAAEALNATSASALQSFQAAGPILPFLM